MASSVFSGLSYDPESGTITGRSGRAVGAKQRSGYVMASARHGGKVHREYAHRLAFALMGFDIPDLVDHINGVKTDNRWANLRSSNKSLNAQNVPNDARPDNSTGFRGVYIGRRGRFIAEIRLRGKKKHIGTFQTAEEAHNAYLSARKFMHEHSPQ